MNPFPVPIPSSHPMNIQGRAHNAHDLLMDDDLLSIVGSFDSSYSHSLNHFSNSLPPSHMLEDPQMRLKTVRQSNLLLNTNVGQSPNLNHRSFGSQSPGVSFLKNQKAMSSAIISNGQVTPMSPSLFEEDDKQILDAEKRARRRASHNAVERRRRDTINEKINELSSLLPETSAFSSQTDGQNKSSILRRSVDHMRLIQTLANRQADRITELEGVIRALMQKSGVLERDLVLTVPLGTSFDGSTNGNNTMASRLNNEIAMGIQNNSSYNFGSFDTFSMSKISEESMALFGIGNGLGVLNTGNFDSSAVHPHMLPHVKMDE